MSVGVEFAREELRICKGARCKECETLPASGGEVRLRLRQWTNDWGALQKLRRVLDEVCGPGASEPGGDVAAQILRLLESGRLHVCRISRERSRRAAAVKRERASAPAPFPLSERSQTLGREPEKPDPDTMPAYTDFTGTAGALKRAAACGAPLTPICKIERTGAGS